jgi:hypothetical protein
MVCRMPHSPTRWLPHSRPESSRLLKVNHYMLHLRIMMSLGGCAASSQNTDNAGPGEWSEVHGAAQYQRYGLPDMDVCTSYFKARGMVLSPSGRRGPTPRLQRRLRRLWRAMVEASGSGAGLG